MLKSLKKFFKLPVKDRKLEPEGYRIETSTWPEAGGENILSGISTALHSGATTVEVTGNHPSSFAPHIMRELKNFIEQENLDINIHTRIQLRIARAIRRDYERVQDYLKGYVEVAEELDSDYINVHTSSFPSPELGRVTGVSRGTTVSPDGKTAEEFIIDMAKKSEKVFSHVIDVLMDSRLPNVTHYAAEDIIREIAEERNVELDAAENEFKRKFRDDDEDLIEMIKEVLRDKFRKVNKLPFETGSRIIDELMMYKMVAWKMYEENHPIWNKICGGEEPDEVADRNMSDLIDAVAGRYIEGHIEKLKDDLESSGVILTLETPNAEEGRFIGYYRLVDPEKIYHVVKSIGHPLVRLCIDFEHIASHGISPAKAMKEAPGGIGEVTYVVHISGEPVPGHRHKPLEKGDIDLYRMLWNLRKKGFEGGYLNFERGGGGERIQEGREDPYQDSLPNLKEIVMYLEDDTPPEELPEEFYGYTDKEFKQERATVLSHTFDPLEGLIETPELKDSLLAKYAKDTEPRMRGEGAWEREEHR
ncbi:MAG: sugar phosphate isomerase/epimerase family protein [Candidatus Aenigmatarchaeota archaeon]